MNVEDLIKIARDTGHHPMGPSAATRWMSCPGSVEYTLEMPDYGSSYAAEGTHAHTLGEICLSENVDAYDVDGFPDDMRDHINNYAIYVRGIADGERIYVEQSLDLNDYIPGAFGTADALVIKGTDLHVIDLKYGMGVVEAENNPQLMIYGLGAVNKLLAKKIEIKEVVLHIFQPRAGGSRTWSISVDDLLVYGGKVARAAELCLEDDAPLNPSEKACQWCKGKATCPALYQKNLELVGGDFEMLPSVENMSDDQIRLVLEHKSLIESWLKAIESHIFSRLEHGQGFEGFKMVEGRSIRKWNGDAETKLVKLMGDAAFDKKLIGITAAEKILGKKQLEELKITEKPPGKPVLVHESDKRPALPVATDDFDTLN